MLLALIILTTQFTGAKLANEHTNAYAQSKDITAQKREANVVLQLTFTRQELFARYYDLNITNYEKATLMFGEDYKFEMLILGHWVNITMPHTIILIGYLIEPGSTRVLKVQSSALLPGTYRLVMPFWVEGYAGTPYENYALFNVGLDPVADITLIILLILAVYSCYYFVRWLRVPRRREPKPVFTPISRPE
jgi:hypothetical protein